jgi:hypothetical protein
VTAASTGDPAGSYIRGAGGVPVDGRRMARILVGLAVLVLSALTVIFTAIAIHHNSRITSLKQRGVPVQVTVTGCRAMASGTGITEAGFSCRGSYTLAGRPYTEPIGGSARQLTVGQKLAGVAVRDEPQVLYTVSSVTGSHSTWTVYITPALLLLAAAGTELFRRRLRSPAEARA